MTDELMARFDPKVQAELRKRGVTEGMLRTQPYGAYLALTNWAADWLAGGLASISAALEWEAYLYERRFPD